MRCISERDDGAGRVRMPRVVIGLTAALAKLGLLCGLALLLPGHPHWLAAAALAALAAAVVLVTATAALSWWRSNRGR
jgi:hypothetical protein